MLGNCSVCQERPPSVVLTPKPVSPTAKPYKLSRKQIEVIVLFVRTGSFVQVNFCGRIVNEKRKKIAGMSNFKPKVLLIGNIVKNLFKPVQIKETKISLYVR